MRILIRVALWPVRMALTLLEWVALFVTYFVGIGCHLMAGGCFLVAVVEWLMGLATIEETVRMLGIGFGFFVIPLAGEWMVCAISKVGRIFN